MPRDTQNASESLYMRWNEKNYHCLITIYLLTTNNMLWIGPYDKKHQNHGIGLTGAQDSAGVPRFTWVSDITEAKHLAHTVNIWPIYDGSITTFLDLNKWRQQGIKVLEGPEGEYD